MDCYTKEKLERLLANLREIDYCTRGLQWASLISLPKKVEMLLKLIDESEKFLMHILAEAELIDKEDNQDD